MEEKDWELLTCVGVPFYANFGKTLYSFQLLVGGDSYFLDINHSSVYKLTDINLFFECFSLSGTMSLRTLLDKSILFDVDVNADPIIVAKDKMYCSYGCDLICFVVGPETQQIIRKDFRVKGGLKYFLELPRESYDTGYIEFFNRWISTAKFTPKADTVYTESFILFICPLEIFDSTEKTVTLRFQKSSEKEYILDSSFNINKCDLSEAINYMVTAITRNFNCSTRFEDYIHD